MNEPKEIVLLKQAIGQFQQGQLDNALSTCKQAIEENPKVADSYNFLGIIYQKQNKMDEAIKALEEALSISPENENLHANIGGIHKMNNDAESALQAFKKAISINSNNAAYYFHAGFSCHNLKRYDEACEFLERCLELEPNNFDAVAILANSKLKSGKVIEALNYLEKAVELKPDDDMAVYNLALANLLLGDYEKGFVGYEKRWQSLDFLDFPEITKSKPMWDGEDIKDKTLFLHTEQGFGDAIMFIRFAKEIENDAKELIIGCKPNVIEIFRQVVPNATWIAEGNPVPEFDYHCPVMSIPRILKTTVETLPADIPYINADENKISEWSEKIDDSKLKVGIVWSGNPKFPDNKNRSSTLKDYENLFDLEGVNFYSLQKGSDEEAIAQIARERENVFDLGALINDFSDTAAILSKLDLLISTDTSVPHLAGAMGIKTYLLACFVPDWRWMLERSDSPWYPNTEIYRQTAPGKWDDVLSQVKSKLEEMK